MWQKARMIKAPGFKSLEGSTVWTNPATIETCLLDTWKDDKIIGHRIDRVVDTNVLIRNNQRLSPNLDWLELLPEFAEDVPLISWEDFINEHRKD